MERRKSHLRFESHLLDVMSDAVIATDPEGRITTWNRAAEQIYGWDREEALGQSLDGWLATQFLETTPMAVEVQLLEHKVWSGVLWQRHRNGDARFIQTTLSLLEDGGRRTGRLAVNRDITQAREAEESLRNSEERWGDALEASHLGVWDWNAVTNQVYFSNSWKAILGFLPEEVGDSLEEWSSRVHPEDLPKCLAALEAHFRGEAADYQSEHRMLSKEGRYQWILDRGKVFEWAADGRPLRVIGTHQDITRSMAERTALEGIARGIPLLQILEELVAGWERAYPATHGSLVLLDPDGRRLRHVVAPGLTKAFRLAMESGDLGTHRTPSHRAAHSGTRVVAADLLEDPQWAGIREPALVAGVAAWWSLPVFSPSGAVFGVLSVQAPHPGSPTAEQLEFLERCASFASVALQREEVAIRLQGAKALLERTGEIAQVGGWELDLAKGTLTWSEEVFRIHELADTRQPTLEETFGFIGPGGQEDYVAAVEGCLSLGRPWDMEVPLITAKGRIKWIRTQGHAEQQAGRTVRIFAAVQDITQRARAEQALESSEALHRTLVETLSEGVLVFDAQGVCIMANAQACQIIGVEAEELLFKRPTDPAFYRLLDPSGAPLESAEHPMQACRLTGQITQGRLLRLIRPGGSASWILLNASPLKAETPQGLRRVVVTFTDVTAAHEADQVRVETLGRLQELRSAIDQANIYALTDAAGRILEVNDEFVRISGYSREELIGANHRLLKSGTHPEAFYQELWRTISSGAIWRGEIQNRAKDGHLYWVGTTIIPLRWENGRPGRYMVFRQDTTEQHGLQETLLQSQKLESVGTLVAGIAHDFNNILMSIGGYTEVLKASKDLTPAQEKGLEVIRRAGDRGRKLVANLLNFSRKNAPQMAEVDLNAAITETAQLFQRGLAERIRLSLHLDPELPPTWLDLDQIQQVLMNLCVNAKDAILGEGELSLSTGLEVLAPEQAARLSLPPGRYVFAAVSDTGQGIPPMVLPRMFEPFFTTKGVGKGTGLGLSVVHGIVHGHGGAIQVESELGAGSTFKVYLPWVEKAADPDLPPVAPGIRGRLLLVAVDGKVEPGLPELVTALRFEAVVMDLAVDWGKRITWFDAVLVFAEAEADWTQAALQLREGPEDVPIILLTSLEDGLFKVPSLHHRVSAVMAAPPRRGEFIDTLNTLIPPLHDR